MDNVVFKDLSDPLTEESVTYAFVSIGDNAYTVMTKAHYEELEAQREQSGTL